jgi:transcriptional regulator with XRE-family HTH domain
MSTRTLVPAWRKLGKLDDEQLSQEHVAWHAGIAVATLAKIENAQTSPGWDSVRRISAALDLTLTQLARAIERESRKG